MIKELTKEKHLKYILNDLQDYANGKFVSPLELVDSECELLLNYITNLQKENENLKSVMFTGRNYNEVLKSEQDYKQRNEKAVENAKEKIKRYESYIHDLKNGNYPSSTVKQERQELIFRIREQEDLLNILQGENDD